MKLLTTLFLGLIVTLCSPEKNLLEQIQAEGELRFATRPGWTTYVEGYPTPRGFEYELAKRFSEELGVTLKVTVAENTATLLPTVTEQQVHFAAAGLAIHHQRKLMLRFGPSYQKIQHQLICRKSRNSPTSLADLPDKTPVYLLQNSNQALQLSLWQQKYPHIQWEVLPNITPFELMKQIGQKKRRYAILDSTDVTYGKAFYPNLQVAFNLPQSQTLAWAFPRFTEDDSLYLAAIRFFSRLQRSGELKLLLERYYGHLSDTYFDDIRIRDFHQHIQERLPLYRKYFEQVATRYHMDWRFLAAMGYQESHWNPKAISRTGVKGIMMLTKMTAEELGIEDREDPFSSIEGGARYLTNIKKRISGKVAEPDKTWLALAAYNIGFGHLIDARKLTRHLRGNENQWIDVKKHLPLLTKPRWYRKTAYGYARGYEPVEFVQNIRQFYDILVYLDEQATLVKSLSPMEKHLTKIVLPSSTFPNL